MSGSQQRPSLQLLLAALAFLGGVIILVVRFGGIAPEMAAPALTPTPLAVAPVVRVTDTPAPSVPSAQPTALPTVMLPSATLEIIPTATQTITPPAATAAPVQAVATATSLLLSPSPVPTATFEATPSMSPTQLPTVTAGTSPSPEASPAITLATQTATATASPVSERTTATASATQSTASPSATPTLTPRATPNEGFRTITLLVEGTQSQADILYEVNGREFIAGNIGIVGLPWTMTVDVLVGSEARVIADGIAESGDLRCLISGATIPTPGITDYDPNPYPQVECLLVVP